MFAPKSKKLAEVYNESSQRWLMLCCVCLNCFFACYIGACTTSMGLRLKDRFDINNVQYNFIFSCYAFPNIFSPIIGGLIVDFLGVNTALIIFAAFPFFGSFIMVVALLIPNYILFCFGYFTLALGGLNTRLAGAVLITKWFRPDQQGMVFGILAVADSVGSLLDASITPRLLETLEFSTAATMAVACSLQGLRFIAAMCPMFVEKSMKITTETDNNKKTKTLAESMQAYSKFGRIYWFLVISIASMFPIALSFGNISVLFLQTKFGYTLVDAGNLQSTQCFINLLIAPLVGYGSDKAGRRGHTMIMGGFLYATAFLTLGIFRFTPYVGCLTMSIASILFQTSAFPSIGLLVREELKGSAFGFMMAMCSLVATCLPIVVGIILEKFNYDTLMIFFATLAFVSIAFVVALINEDYETGKRLWTSQEEIQDGEDTPLVEQKSD